MFEDELKKLDLRKTKAEKSRNDIIQRYHAINDKMSSLSSKIRTKNIGRGWLDQNLIIENDSKYSKLREKRDVIINILSASNKEINAVNQQIKKINRKICSVKEKKMALRKQIVTLPITRDQVEQWPCPSDKEELVFISQRGRPIGSNQGLVIINDVNIRELGESIGVQTRTLGYYATPRNFASYKRIEVLTLHDPSHIKTVLENYNIENIAGTKINPYVFFKNSHRRYMGPIFVTVAEKENT